ncbi:MATE family efflux transporter [Muricomes sp. OA1]|uniref:Probable multidrug resistance protein NorM n=2 Tax=Lachnospiraceae TaxID=186803 RepID=A0A3E2X114_9FIRM|nr:MULTISPECIES: MATE family efflux transporter [Clostridia]MCH1971221.1 MATE family efflux transporter [Muricomes sp. OA1]RGC34977.1 MATE family efflux transporter [Hungatella hathewayi]GKH34519.1 MATE family multidrug exporter [Faecalicatena contorta]
MKKQRDRSAYLFDNKALRALIIPLIIEQLLAILVGMADSIMIASVGEAAVSGVSLVDNIMVLFINAFGALAAGGAVISGQYLGQKSDENACEASNQIVWFITIVAVGIMAIIYCGKWFILHVVFGAIDADVMAHANTYLLIVSASIPFMALYNAGAAIFRAMGNSKVSMQVSIIMNLINIGGNALLIYGFHRGTEGVAIPTLISRVVAAVIITVLLTDQKRQLHISRSFHYRPDWRMIRRILSIGVPNGLENSMFQLGKIMVLSLVSTFGTYAIAANAVSNAVALFQILPGIALNLAITSVIAMCVGAGDYEQAHYYTKKLVGIVYVLIWIMNAVIFLLLPFILKAYHLSDLTAETTKQILYFHSISCMIVWPVAFSLPATLRAAGDAKVTMIISIASMWIFRIVFSYILGRYMGLGVFGVWVAMVIDWCFRAVFMMVRYYGGKWKLMRSI